MWATCITINIYFVTMFSVSREGGWEFHPFLGQRYPPNFTAFTHPNARVFKRVLRKHTTGKHDPKQSQCLQTHRWRKNMFCPLPGWNLQLSRLCPDCAIKKRPRQKGLRWVHADHLVWCGHFSDGDVSAACVVWRIGDFMRFLYFYTCVVLFSLYRYTRILLYAR